MYFLPLRLLLSTGHRHTISQQVKMLPVYEIKATPKILQRQGIILIQVKRGQVSSKEKDWASQLLETMFRVKNGELL